MLSNTTSAIGWKGRDFALPAVDGKTYSLADVRGPQGTLVVFICNHCPYVKARCESEHRPDRGGGGSIARDRGGDDRDLPNDTDTCAEDPFDNMKAIARQSG
jgi:hypothetical protein